MFFIKGFLMLWFVAYTLHNNNERLHKLYNRQPTQHDIFVSGTFVEDDINSAWRHVPRLTSWPAHTAAAARWRGHSGHPGIFIYCQ